MRPWRVSDLEARRRGSRPGSDRVLPEGVRRCSLRCRARRSARSVLVGPRALVESPTVGAESRLESIGFEHAHDYAAGKDPMKRGERIDRRFNLKKEHRRKDGGI
jgi:hypothetical protein